MADHSIILGYGSPLFQHFVAAAYVKRTGKEAKQNMLQDVARFILFSFSMLQYIHVEVPKSGPLQHRMPPATAAQRAVPGQWTTAAAAIGGSLPKDSLGVPARITLRESNMASWEIHGNPLYMELLIGKIIYGGFSIATFDCHVWFPEGMDQGNSAISIISSRKKESKNWHWTLKVKLRRLNGKNWM